MKRPAFQFYPADWRKDVELRSCSLAARGLWIDLLCIAHECEPYGHLTINGRPMNAGQIAGQVGITKSQCATLLKELVDNGVARETPDGSIYSKRMVDDEGLRNRRAEGGKAGSEHGAKGAEHGIKGGRPVKARGVSEPPSHPPIKPPPSSSSSSSPSGLTEANASGGEPPDGPTPKVEIDPAEAIFALGLPLLLAASVPDKNARSFLGFMRKQAKDDSLVLDAISRCVAEHALQPIEFLQGCLKSTKASVGKHSGFAEKNYREGVQADGYFA